MSNFINYSEDGITISFEEVYVANKTEITLAHDNFFEVHLFYDEAMENEIPEILYMLGGEDSNYNGYNKIILESDIYSSYDYIYAAYKTKGDYVDAEDFNKKQDFIVEKKCGENIIAYRAVMLKGGEIYYPDMTIPSDIRKIIGISKQSGVLGQKIQIYTCGEITNNIWNWDTTKDVFVSSNGELTQTLPSGNIKIIAVPLSNTTVEITKNNEIIRGV